jgi:hypothetical protein
VSYFHFQEKKIYFVQNWLLVLITTVLTQNMKMYLIFYNYFNNNDSNYQNYRKKNCLKILSLNASMLFTPQIKLVHSSFHNLNSFEF